MKILSLSMFVARIFGAAVIVFIAPVGPVWGQVQLSLDSSLEISWSDAIQNSSVFLQESAELQTGNWTDLCPPDEVPGVGPVSLAGDGIRHFYRAREVRRGEVVAVEDRGTISALTINFALALAGISTTVDFSVAQAKITYRTLSPKNEPTVASGLFSWPVNAPGARSLLSYQHVTILEREDAPSVAGSTEGLVALVTAGRGYISALPDYLGFGEAPGLHPYVHSKASATAVIDMLRAVRSEIARRSINWDNRLFLIGYSQGGGATMATHRMLQEQHAGEWTVSGSIPMAGPYDFSGTMYNELIDRDTPFDRMDFLPYVLFGWEQVYGPLGPDADILRAPYDTTLRPLFDGQTSAGTIQAAMPASGIPSDIFQPAYLAAVKADPNHPLRQWLQRNDLHTGWVPQAPMHLIHCQGDELVPVENALVALAAFRAAGSTSVTLSTPDFGAGLGHTDCATPALLEAIDWLDER